MWELGVGVGLYNISGDVPSLMLWNKGGYGFSAHVRKALGYVGSVRLDYNYGNGKGLEFQPSSGYMKDPAWNGTNNGYNYAGKPVFYNYKTESHQLNLDVVISLGNILFHHTRTKVDPYIFGGIAANAYQTWINALNDGKSGFGPNSGYDFTAIMAKYGPNNFQHSDRKAIKKDLQEIFDDSYETNAETDARTRRPTFFSTKKLSFAATFGAGVQYRISRRINLSLEDRVTFFPTTNEDLLDGQRWDENTVNVPGPGVIGIPSQNKDGINYLSLGFNFNLGGGSRNVEPLYWLNPLDYSYGELSTPRHMILPDPILPDADGDGIADQFDKCPGTPAGVAVDSHGCPMDTDGDGVPDDRDKQLITPTECQPVDADGVGKCPCHCEGQMITGTCGNIAPGNIMFAPGSARITPSMEAQLATLAAQMQANPDCRVVVAGNAGGSKLAQQRSWDRVNAVIEYMSEKSNIDRNRFIFQYEGAAPENGVMYRSANEGEEGPSNVAPPHPDLRR